MSVQAKLRVEEKNQRAKWDGKPGEEGDHTVKLRPVGGPGNEEWSKATPAGSVELTITNPAALSFFVLGGEYVATFTRVDEAG